MKYARPAARDPRLVLLSDDAPSRKLDTLWPDEIENSPVLTMMKRRVWSREIWAQVLERLVNAGAQVVAFDYLFDGEEEGDAALKSALEKHAARVVIGARFEDAFGSTKTNEYTIPPPSVVPPSDPDRIMGYVNLWKDEDDVVRKIRFYVSSLQVQGYSAESGADDIPAFVTRMAQKAGMGDRVPADRFPHVFRFAWKGEMLRGGHKRLSLYEIFVPTFWEQNYDNGAFFKDKIVLVGPEGNFSKDIAKSPFGYVSGPELHLNGLNAVLTGAFLRETPVWVDFILIFVGGLFAWLFSRFVSNPILRMGLVVAAAAGWFFGAVALYNANWVVLVFSPALALVSSASVFSIIEQVLERLEKGRLRRTFERYVSRDVVKELIDNPEGWLNTLGGVRKKITVLFSDVRGFTTMTESAEDPAKLVAQLNEYFTDMVRIVFEHNGTLDKFIGDAVMAHWGSIVTEGEKTDAVRAVASALDMQRALARLNAEWKPRGLIELHFGIGINHGEAIVGNLGSEEKREVSAIGDPVNIASRLEGVTKEYHVEICFGESVEALVRDDFIIRSLDLILVKGKTRPVEVFTVLAERKNGNVPPPWLVRHEEAMRAYRAGAFDNAAAAWRDVLAQAPDDGVAQLFLQRCAELQAHPPEGEWRGVFQMKSK